MVFFGGIAVLLAGIGTYRVVSYPLSQKIAEMGVRLALGATPASVLWLLFAERDVIVSLVAVTACCIPGSRAARIEPLDALRYE